jgi:predicted Zn-dependent peptidase
MSVETSTLDNGLTVVSHDMPHVETVALGIWTKAGARDEAVEENGLAHLLEHMAFKGTSKRTAFDIAVEIEAAGGDMNASTSMESTAYYARVLRNDWELALDVISDIVMDPVFGEDDLALEKGVILQEIAASRDTPDDLVFDLAQGLAWPDHALGRDILGTPKTVKSFSQESLADYRNKHYTTSRMVVSAAGRIDHAALVAAVSERLSGIRAGGTVDRSVPAYAGGHMAKKRPLDQVHQVMAFDSQGYFDKDIYALHLLASVLGGGMSSRLFQEVRERRGLCYSTFAHVSAFADSGLMQIYAATAPDTAAEFCKVAADVLLDVTRSVDLAELDRARAQLKASLVMSLESPSARADQIARQHLVYGKVPEVSEILAKVDAVEVDDVTRVAAQTFTGSTLSLAVVGDTSQLANSDELAARFA